MKQCGINVSGREKQPQTGLEERKKQHGSEGKCRVPTRVRSGTSGDRDGLPGTV